MSTVLNPLFGFLKVFDNFSKPGGTVQRCEWRLRVCVHSREPFWPSDRVRIRLEEQGGNHSAPSEATRMLSKNSPEVVFSGTGSQTYKVTADADDWLLVEAKRESVRNGDDKRVDLDIQSFWLGLRIEDQRTGKLVSDVEVVTGAHEGTTAKDTLYLLGLNPAENEIKEMSHDEVWEFVDHAVA